MALAERTGVATLDVQRSRNAQEKPLAAHPDFLIKYESVNEPSPLGGHEEGLVGSESDAIALVQMLIEQGRTTPGRVQIYANVNASIGVAVTFPKNPSR